MAMSIVFQPRIEVKKKHLYLLAVFTVLILGSAIFAAAQSQGQGNAPESVREMLSDRDPASWASDSSGGDGASDGGSEGSTGGSDSGSDGTSDGSSDSGDSGSATISPAATHKSTDTKAVFGGEVITVQEALEDLKGITDSNREALSSISDEDNQLCTVGVQKCVTLVESSSTRYRGTTTKKKTNCGPKKFSSGGWTGYAEAETPSSSMSPRGRRGCSSSNRCSYSRQLKTKTRVFVDCSVDIDTVYYQWNDGRMCTGGCGASTMRSNAGKTKTLIYDSGSSLNVEFNGKNNPSTPSTPRYGFGSSGSIDSTSYSSARLALTQIHHHSDSKDFKAAFSIHDVDIDMNNNQAKVHYGKNWGGSWGAFHTNDIGSGSNIPIDGNWHTIASVEDDGSSTSVGRDRHTHGDYQVKFESSNGKVWMYDRLKLLSNSKSVVNGAITANRFVEKEQSE